MDAVALDAELSMLADARSFSGVVRVDGPGGPWFAQAYGLASYSWGVPCSLHTRFDTASITKLFTAVATLQQIEAGAFDLDTSVIDYLGLSGTQISPDVTTYHLLTHTSGIGDDADEEAGETVRGPLGRQAQLLGHRDGALPPELRRQGAELRARRGVPVLQRAATSSSA